ncbi:hypothetical protein [Streptomyces sp. SID5910]|uniref:hypothetical protein n=1 Tax=Streptomyces sp. SID5910 TaxID=2690312 RepID=UPI00136FA04F|nr:hypothetical protein [Streptomyces sp. SID5910]MYR46108.1 hypothetical protein [Streptomyces sp. SID5910]
MSENTAQSATELASQYSVQVASDLERNVKEQERVSGEITDLQQQLAALQHDHALLVNMQQALGVTTPPAPSAADPAPVPAPRDSAAAETAAAGRRTRSGKAGTAPKRAAATKPRTKPAGTSGGKPATKSTTKPAAKSASKAPAKSPAKTATKPSSKAVGKSVGKAAAKKAPAPSASSTATAVPSSSSASSPAAAKPAQPTLVELVRRHLSEQKEPRSAAEVTTALGQAHSDRTIKTTVVRTTLEGLVAKNQAQRTKQGTSVYYTATDAPEPKQDDAGAQPAADRADD